MHTFTDGQPHTTLALVLGIVAGLFVFGMIAINNRRKN
jgi:hypothetical protein